MNSIMPRLARLDAPVIIHHVITRGIERREIFRDNRAAWGFSPPASTPLFLLLLLSILKIEVSDFLILSIQFVVYKKNIRLALLAYQQYTKK